MSRKLSAKIRLEFVLKTLSPLHVGGSIDDVDTDMPLLKDGRGRYYLPGTSLAGAIRAWAFQAYPKHQQLVEQTFGFQNEYESNSGHASYILVEDSVIVENPQAPIVPEIRDGVGIDRYTGGAVDGVKFDRAILPRDTQIPVTLTLEVPKSETTDGGSGPSDDSTNWFGLALLRRLVNAFANREIRLGAGKSRGLGAVECEKSSVEFRWQNFDSPEELIAALSSHDGYDELDEDRIAALTPDFEAQPSSKTAIVIQWQPIDALMVKAGFEGVGADMLPLVSYRSNNVHLVLPGSSLKGAFRSTAERIMRTVADDNLGKRTERADSNQFIKDVDLRLVDWLFGRAASADRRAGAPSAREPGLAAVAFLDCYSKDSATMEQWNQIAGSSAEVGESGMPIMEAIRQLSDQGPHFSEMTIGFHNAVDRWTGGAADGFLYTVLEPYGIKWEPIQLELDRNRLPEDPDMRKACEYLLLLVIEEMSLGRVPIGFGTTRGMGEVLVEQVRCGEPSEPTPIVLDTELTTRLSSWQVSLKPDEAQTA